MLRLITDFDGPIMDVSERYYQVYLYCLAQIKATDQLVKTLSKEEFWNLKRAQVPEKEIGLMSGLDLEQAQAFAKLRRKTVHTLPYLVYDQPIPGAIATLEKIQSLGLDLVVMTMRRVCELDFALKSHDLARFFPEPQRYCLSDDYVKTTDVQDKPRLMARALQELTRFDTVWMVGDTEADAIAAKTYQIPFIGVLSGIRDRDRLAQHQPNFIVNNLGEALELILSNQPNAKSY
ncbi:MAG: HAD family hydrolase [Snowella sp.]|nr:HAD family hydrolase [Snowella sp.]